MAESLTDRELRRIERQRRKEAEEERKMIMEMERELKEKHEKAMRDLKQQQDKMRQEKSEKLERRKRLLEKQYQLEEMKAEKRILEDREELFIDPDIEVYKQTHSVQERHDDIREIEEELSDRSEDSEDSIHSGVSFVTVDEIKEQNEVSYIGEPKDASSYIDCHEDELRSIDREMMWLDKKAKEIELENRTLERSIDRSSDRFGERNNHTERTNRSENMRDYKVKGESDKHSERIDRTDNMGDYRVKDMTLVGKHKYSKRVTDKPVEEYNIKREYKSVDRDTSVYHRIDTSRRDKAVKLRENRKLTVDGRHEKSYYNSESDEELEIVKKKEKLQVKKDSVEKEIERNKQLKAAMKRKEIEMKKLQELKLKEERVNQKKERLQKLKSEKEKLEKELKEKEDTLSILVGDKEVKAEVKEEKKVENTQTECKQWTGKLLKPTIPSLTETTFDEWKIEVQIIMNSELYEENILRQAVRNSLCGQTRKILATMSPSITTKEIIEKLESVYGNVKSGESVLAEFYMARQRRDEGVADWGIRLESIVQKAIEKGHVKDDQKEEMLKTRFWRQLYCEELRNATRMYFETSHTFEELRRKVRMEENEMKISHQEMPKTESDKATIQQQTESGEQVTVLTDLAERIKLLEAELSRSKEREHEERYRYRHEERGDIGNTRYSDRYDRGRRRNTWNSRDRDTRNIRGREVYREQEWNRDYRRYRPNNDRDFTDYRDRGRYSPRDRRNDRRYYDGNDREQRYNRDNRTDNYREYRDRRDQVGERDYNRDRNDRYRENRDRRGEVDERGYRRDRYDTEYERDYKSKETNETKEKCHDRNTTKDREETQKKTQSDEGEKKSSLNSKTSLSGGR